MVQWCLMSNRQDLISIIKSWNHHTIKSSSSSTTATSSTSFHIAIMDLHLSSAFDDKWRWITCKTMVQALQITSIHQFFFWNATSDINVISHLPGFWKLQKYLYGLPWDLKAPFKEKNMHADQCIPVLSFKVGYSWGYVPLIFQE